MGLSLYTQDELTTLTSRVTCCASNQAYKALKAKRAGSGQYKCIYNKHLYLQEALCVLEGYTVIGSLLDPGEAIHPATYASVTVNLNILSDTGAYFNVVLEIDGVDMIPGFVNGFYTTLDDYGQALEAAFDAATLLYDATYYLSTDLVQPNTLVITALNTGSGYNLPITFSFIQDRFFETIEIPTIPTSSFNTPPGNVNVLLGVPYIGDYVDTTGDVIYSGWGSQAMLAFNETSEVKAVDIGGSSSFFSALYNPTLDLIYNGDTASGKVNIYDSSFNITPDKLDIGSNQGAMYYDITTDKIYIGTYGTNEVLVFDGLISGLGLMTALYTITLVDIGYVSHISKNPVTNEIWISQGASSIITIADPNSNTIIGSIDISSYTPSILHPFLPTDAFVSSFVDNNGVWECWIGGSAAGTASCLIIDATTQLIVQTIDISPQVGTCHDIKQNSVNGYVYFTSINGGTSTTLIVDSITKNGTANAVPVLIRSSGLGSEGIVEHKASNKMFISTPGGTNDGTTVQVLDYEQTLFSINSNLTGGDEANDVYIPPTYSTEETTNNCITQDEMYTIIENVKKICGCCCEFDDDILQRDIS